MSEVQLYWVLNTEYTVQKCIDKTEATSEILWYRVPCAVNSSVYTHLGAGQDIGALAQDRVASTIWVNIYIRLYYS